MTDKNLPETGFKCEFLGKDPCALDLPNTFGGEHSHVVPHHWFDFYLKRELFPSKFLNGSAQTFIFVSTRRWKKGGGKSSRGPRNPLDPCRQTVAREPHAALWPLEYGSSTIYHSLGESILKKWC